MNHVLEYDVEQLKELILSVVREYVNSEEYTSKVARISRKNSYHPCDDWKPMSLEEACNDR